VHRAVLIALAISGCNSGSATPSPALRSNPRPAPHDAARDADIGRLAGAPLYLALCAPCHGIQGQGYAADHAPSLVNPTFLESASDDFLRRSIGAGRPGTSMAAYAKALGGPLDPAGVDRLVGFLRDHGPAPRQLPAGAAGDAAIGAVIYAKRCVVCHGDTRTRGEAVSLANPQLQVTASDAFLRHAIVNGRPGTKMEAFAGQLTDRELDGVVAYIRSFGAAGGTPVARLPAPTGTEPVVVNPSGKPPRFTLRADPCPLPVPNATAPCTPDPRFVPVAQVAAALAARQRMVIIDARAPSEWMRVHIPGAVSIPYHDLKRLDELPRDGTWIIAYCGCPHHLSGIVVDELRKRGYARAVVLDEGIDDWHRRGFPVVAAEGVTRPLGEPGAPPPPGQRRSR
jgi:mono/diheme cytochrome c family protein/rhodanese-related sulfurtransferase